MLERIQPVAQQLPRTTLNLVTKARGWTGEPLGAHLLRTFPEEREWTDAGIVGGIGSSDKGDGFGARLLAELGLLELDDESAELDRASDRNFVMPQQLALTLNGEVPPIHYGLKVLREFGMGTRAWTGVLAGAGMESNKRRDISDVISGMIVAAKINTVEERRDVIVHGEESRYCLGVKEEDREKFIEDAAIRHEVIEPHAKLGMATGALLLARSAPALLSETR